MWERVIERNSEILNQAIWMIVENQVEFLGNTEEDWKEFLGNLSQKEYDSFIRKIVDNFWDRDSIWQEIDGSITQLANESREYSKVEKS